MTQLVGINIKKSIDQVARNNAARLMEALTVESTTVDIEVLWSMDAFIPKGILPIAVRSALIGPLRKQITEEDYTPESRTQRAYVTKAWDIMVHSLFKSETMNGEDVSIVLPLGALSQVMHTLEILMTHKQDALTVLMMDRQYVPVERLVEYNSLQRTHNTLSSVYATALESATKSHESQEVEASEQ